MLTLEVAVAIIQSYVFAVVIRALDSSSQIWLTFIVTDTDVLLLGRINLLADWIRLCLLRPSVAVASRAASEKKLS